VTDYGQGVHVLTVLLVTNMRYRHKCYHLSEAVIRICLLLLFLDLELRDPFIRVVQPEELWLYRNPMTDSYLPSDWLWRMVAFVPLGAILGSYALTRDQTDLTTATLVTTLATPLTGVLTNIIKLAVGRPRPDFVFRCWPDGTVPLDAFTSSELPCTGDRDVVMEGRKSFPSGHSSFSFATWGFVFLYLSGKLGTFRHSEPGQTWKLLLSLSLLVAPLMIAISRTADYHHHWQDVVAGSILGMAVVWLIYRQHYPSITSPHSAQPLVSSAASSPNLSKDHVDHGNKGTRLQV